MEVPVNQNATVVGGYWVRRVPLTDIPDDVQREWREFVRSWDAAEIVHEIEWLRAEWSDDVDRLFALFVYDGPRLIAIAPFVVKSWPLALRLGELEILELPLRRLCSLGFLALPDDARVYEALFRELAETEDYDALFFEMVERGCYVDRFMADNDALSKRFRAYSEGGVRSWHRIRFPPTADEYFKKFSSKTRATQRRKIRKLAGDHPGDLVVERFDSLERLDEFILSAVEVSRRSYQWHLLGKGLRDADKFEQEVKDAARHGWLRAYLLKVGDRAMAFMVGYQYNGAYLYKEVGFDQQVRKYSPGTVLQVLVIDDLYAHKTPRTFEFGVHGEQKAAFGNEVVDAESVFLIRRGVYPALASGAYRVWSRGSDLAIEGLERLGVKKKVKQLVRRLSVTAGSGNEPAEDRN